MSTATILQLATVVVAVASTLFAGWQTGAKWRLQGKYEAEKRFQGAVGTLHLGLVLSARSFVSRVQLYAERPLPFRVGLGSPVIEHHNAGLFVYRLLRPLAHGVIIEHQLYLRDLAWDPALNDMLRFNHAAFEMLTGDKLTEDFPGADRLKCWWPARPTGAVADLKPPWQRVRSSYLRTAASKLVVPQDGHERVMYHEEFLDLWEPGEPDRTFMSDLGPVASVIDGLDQPVGEAPVVERPRFSIENAIVWLRLVGYAYTCHEYFERVRKGQKKKLRFEPIAFSVREMLQAASDEHLSANAAYYEERIVRLASHAL